MFSLSVTILVYLSLIVIKEILLIKSCLNPFLETNQYMQNDWFGFGVYDI